MKNPEVSRVTTPNVSRRQRKAMLRSADHCFERRIRVDLLLFLLLLAAFLPSYGLAQGEPDESGPLLLSVSPLTGQRGSTFRVEVRGNRLDGLHAVWSDSGELKGRILGVEEVKDKVQQKVNPLEKPKRPEAIYRALIELHTKGASGPGTYPLRLVSHRGVSNSIGFPLVDVPVSVEGAGSHETISQAQPVAVPGVISGTIGEPGETDYYRFQARKGQRLWFQALEGHKFNSGGAAAKFALELALYRTGKSWFDPQRPDRVLFDEQRSSDLMQVEAEGACEFPEDGQYYLQVSGLFGQGCPDCTYQVQVTSAAARRERLAPDKLTNEWLERSLDRSLTESWIERLEARSVKETGRERVAETAPGVPSAVPAAATAESKQPALLKRPQSVMELEPNNLASQAGIVSLPAFIEGTIESPGDVDSFKIIVDAGQKLAFEVETPDAKPPHFNPRIGLLDAQDREQFSNVERRLSMYNNNADPQVYLKAVRAKAVYGFERAGEYVLQARDMTTRYGNPSYRYRLLVRPQIPHVGEILVLSRDSGDATPEETRQNQISRLNLVRGEPKKLTLTAFYEEGFTGDLSFFFAGLPEGVQAYPAINFNEGRAPLEVMQNPDIVAAKPQKTALVLLASPEASLTSEPRSVELRCQTISNGKLGPNLLVRKIPLMVVERSAQEQRATPRNGN